MSNFDATNREQLIKAVNLARAALATQDYIPAYKHFCFADGFVSAYNDIAAIKIKNDLDLEVCIPGEMLIKALGSFNAEKVLLQPNDDGSLLISSGRSKLKVPTLPAKDFPLAIPDGKKVPVVGVAEGLLLGIQRCLISAGNDPTHPATMGVPLDQEDGKAVLFSTDNVTISRFATKHKTELPGDAPVILPRFFCEQLVALSKAFPFCVVDVELHAGALVAYFFDEHEVEHAVLFQKTLVDLEPLDFPKIIGKHVKVKGLADQLTEIPPAFDAAFDRALLVLGAEADKATKITQTDEAIKLLSTSSVGEASDSITCDSLAEGEAPVEPFLVDPTMVSRAFKACTHMALLPRIMVMANKDASFVHLIAHCSA